jgi:hypothetical protein
VGLASVGNGNGDGHDAATSRGARCQRLGVCGPLALALADDNPRVPVVGGAHDRWRGVVFFRGPWPTPGRGPCCFCACDARPRGYGDSHHQRVDAQVPEARGRGQRHAAPAARGGAAAHALRVLAGGGVDVLLEEPVRVRG